MKKLILFLAFLCLVGIAKAQQYVAFPDSNVTWRTVNYQQGACDYPDFCKYEDTYSGDTIINAIIYHKIIERNNSNYTYHYIGALRELNRKIYFMPNNCFQDKLYYNFNLFVGDTINVPLGSSCFTAFNDILYLGSIDSILINNHYRRRFNFEEYDYGDTTYWIEGIGSSRGLFYPGIPHVTCYCPWYLTCFLQDNLLLYNQNIAPYSFCYPLTSIEIILNNENKINIFPNPSTDNISIESRPSATIEISNIQGLLIKTLAASDTKTNVDVSALPCGVYVVQVKTETEIAVKKFIKE